ncbi:MAG: hydroxymethylglutaryl-CoA lyase [Acidimicrobiales bacterium]
MSLPDAVTITDVVLRDGLQDEPVTVATADKLRLLDGLLGAGLRSVEIGAFVRPDRVPQMADSDQLFSLAPRRDGVTYSGLVLNARGASRAVAAGVAEARLVVSASEGHSRANSGSGVAEVLDSLDEAAATLAAASPGTALVGGIATAFVCPYDGPTPPARVAAIARRLVAAGARWVSLADTLGAATPHQVRAGVRAVREALPDVPVGLHLHDTHGMALACAWEALQLGVDRFDAALGGIGGCPFAPGAAGNAATEDLLGLLHGVGIRTGIDLERLLDLVPLLSELVGHDVDSHQWRARACRAPI